MSQTKITTDNINTLDASMLTGSALPALNGAALTNIPGVTNSASDPTISTNPSGGVGTAWLNTTSGELFCCTDATTGANVWTNVGKGSGNIPIPHRTIAGYASGGHANSPGVNTSLIQRYSFTSDGNASTHGDLTSGKQVSESGTSSTTHGFVAGGSPLQNNIDKFAFASNTTAAGHGVLTRTTHSGAGSYSSTDGFHAGGEGPNNTVINKFSFASNTTAADHGDLETAYNQICGTMSSTDGYSSGGHPSTNKIQKFAFSSNTTAADHGDLTRSIRLSCGQSSTTHGYNTGGGEPARTNVIEKFSFGSSSNATDVGDMTITVSYQAGHEQ